jgi:primosomal protein N''
MNEEMSVFKSYLRRLLQDLKDLKEAAEKEDLEKVKELVNKLIEDTQKGIED